MRRFSIFLVIIVLFAALTGCSTNMPYTPSTETLDISAFSAPDGFDIEFDTQTSALIKRDGEIVGGIHLTGLKATCIHEKTHRSVAMYLDYLAPMPLIPEWILMQGEDFLSINLAITDPDKDIRTETSRRIFVKGGLVYDLWCYCDIYEEIDEFSFWDFLMQ